MLVFNPKYRYLAKNAHLNQNYKKDFEIYNFVSLVRSKLSHLSGFSIKLYIFKNEIPEKIIWSNNGEILAKIVLKIPINLHIKITTS